MGSWIFWFMYAPLPFAAENWSFELGSTWGCSTYELVHERRVDDADDGDAAHRETYRACYRREAVYLKSGMGHIATTLQIAQN